MSRMQKIKSFIGGLFLILISIFLIVFPEGGLGFVAFVLSLTMIVTGLRYLTYYLSMARHMVGGKSILFYSVILLDFGLFTMALSDIPRIYLALYLMFINVFSAVLEIVRGIDAMRKKSPSWKFSMSQGIINLVLAFFCVVFIRSETVLVYIFCFGMLYNGIVKVISAFRRTAIVYIQ